jgi:hypothetical protein
MQARALECAVRGRELRLGIQVGEVLHDRRAFADRAAVVEFEDWHVGLGLHGLEVAAVGELLRREIDLDEIELDAKLAQHDVRRQRTGSGRVVEFHALSPRLIPRGAAILAATVATASMDLMPAPRRINLANCPTFATLRSIHVDKPNPVLSHEGRADDMPQL